jgi:hypothetical protein
MTDFSILRKQRNDSVAAATKQLADQLGFSADSIVSNFDPEACYCDCANGGPCEHAFDGATEYDDGGCMVWTRVCSKCGCTALSHDMHNMW